MKTAPIIFDVLQALKQFSGFWLSIFGLLSLFGAIDTIFDTHSFLFEIVHLQFVENRCITESGVIHTIPNFWSVTTEEICISNYRFNIHAIVFLIYSISAFISIALSIFIFFYNIDKRNNNSDHNENEPYKWDWMLITIATACTIITLFAAPALITLLLNWTFELFTFPVIHQHITGILIVLVYIILLIIIFAVASFLIDEL